MSMQSTKYQFPGWATVISGSCWALIFAVCGAYAGWWKGWLLGAGVVIAFAFLSAFLDRSK